MIKRIKGGYKVVSKAGKSLSGTYTSRASAVQRLKQVEYFKRKRP